MRVVEHVGGLEVVTQIHNSIAFVGLTGVVTPGSLALVKAAVMATLAQAGRVMGFVVRLTNADVKCSASELTSLLDDLGPADQATVPAALVVSVEQMPLLKAHVWQCAWRGVVRQAFTDATSAVAWLNQRAEAAAQTRAGLTPAK